MTTFFLVRHAPAIRPSGLLYGQLDYPADLSNGDILTVAAATIPSNAAVVSSDLLRCRMTTEALMASRSDLLGPEFSSELREQSFGDYEGKRRSEFFAHSAKPYWLFPRTFRPPGGESFDDLSIRASHALKKLAVIHVGGAVAVVTHGNFIRAAVANALQLEGDEPAELTIGHCGVVLLESDADKRVSFEFARGVGG